MGLQWKEELTSACGIKEDWQKGSIWSGPQSIDKLCKLRSLIWGKLLCEDWQKTLRVPGVQRTFQSVGWAAPTVAPVAPTSWYLDCCVILTTRVWMGPITYSSQ